ncbi:hypothetical protein LTR15_006161 [Elasticomyces elasticus]|nr:hypothetical protein LTR15_006161 [Elasticomyces elasticus]
MRSFAFVGALLAGLSQALPRDGACVTVTDEVIIPTGTNTYTTTDVTTIHATTAEDLGTFTLVTRLSSTKTLLTLTSTIPACSGSSVPYNATSTVYTTSVSAPVNAPSSTSIASPPGYYKRALAPRQDACTTTTTFTTTYGETYTFVAAPNATSTFTDYTAFVQATVTSTQTGGTAYTVATATTSEEALWCPTGTSNMTVLATATTTQDARCAPSAMTSAYSGYGLEYSSDVPASGTYYKTTTSDASSCCQLCADIENCAASIWDIRTNVCKLEFPVSYSTGELSCGQGALVYYDAGPVSPMEPGSGLWVAQLCGNVYYGNAKPDDGT